LGHINRRGPVFGCRAVYPLHVNSIWCRAGVHTCAVKMGLFPQNNVSGHIKSVVIPTGEGLFFSPVGFARERTEDSLRHIWRAYRDESLLMIVYLQYDSSYI
ncbi:MAG: hypothetical protein V3V99_01015, partial [candidate division Zixibacteria bacterium]